MYKQTKDNASIIRLSDNAFIPMDNGNSDYQAYKAWVAAGNKPQPVDAPTFDELVAANTAAVQDEMERQAQAKGYSNLISACTYAAQPAGAPFQAEGQAFADWRSKVWQQAYAVLAEVKAGTRAMPTPAEAVAMMPALVLPA